MLQYVTAALMAARGDTTTNVPALIIDDQVRYFIDTDVKGHPYAIPVHRRDDWCTWLSKMDGSDAPDFAQRVKSGFTFANPRD